MPKKVWSPRKRKSRRKHKEHIIRSRFSHANQKKGTHRPNGYTVLKDFEITEDNFVINLYDQRAKMAMT
jgi:hypothetical protein